MDDVKAPNPYTEMEWVKYQATDEEYARIKVDKVRVIGALGGNAAMCDRWMSNLEVLLGIAAALTVFHGKGFVMDEESFVMNARECYRAAINCKLDFAARAVKKAESS